jgi:hypothetical protein
MNESFQELTVELLINGHWNQHPVGPWMILPDIRYALIENGNSRGSMKPEYLVSNTSSEICQFRANMLARHWEQ